VTSLPSSVNFLVTRDTKGYQVLSRVIAEAAPRLNVMDLKIFRAPAELATPTVPLQNFVAELTICLKVKLQAWPLGSMSSQVAA
jgi:hypothetical protein